MSRQEFIDRLRAALNGRIPAPQVEDTVNYYQDYINTEIRKGRTEEEVLQSLGDPRLIARTIVQTSGDSEHVYEQESAEERYTNTAARRSLRIPGWLVAVLVILSVLLIISVVFSVLSFLAPFLIVFLAVVFLVKLFRDWLN